MSAVALWNRCFLCSTPLRTLLPLEEGVKRNNFNFTRHKILIQYLLNDYELKNPLSMNLLDFARDSNISKIKSEFSPIPPSTLLANLCGFCEKLADSLVALKLELEMIQMKIVDKLRTVKKSIISNSRLYGENIRVKQDWDDFEESIKHKESDGMNCEQERKFAEAVHEFQTAVFSCDVVHNQIPLVYLEKYSGKKSLMSTENFKDMEANDIKLEPVDSADLMQKYYVEDSNFDYTNNNDDEYVPPVKKRKRKGNSVDDKYSRNNRARVPVKRSSRNVAKQSTYKDTTKASIISKLKTPRYAEHLTNVVNLHRQLSRETKAKRKAYKVNRRHWKCFECMYEVSSLYKFTEEHLRTHETSEKTMECPACNVCFTTKQALELHLSLHLKQEKCDVCNESVPIADMESHLKLCNNNVFSCPRCAYCFGIFQNLANHAAKHNCLMLKCGMCPEADAFEYHTRSDLPRHLFERHGCANKLFTCDFPECSKTFYNIQVYRLHQTEHSRLYVCTICDKSYSTKLTLEVHNRRRHPELATSLLSCGVDSCGGATFSCKDELLRHEIMEHNHPKLVCEFCNPKKEFIAKGTLQKHQRKHHGVGKFQIYQCTHCPKKFKLKELLLNHEGSHIGKNLTCEVCGYATHSLRYLQRHSRIHKERERKYKCSYCEKGFYRKEALDNHIRTHTLERPYQCDECGAAFTQPGPLNAHKKKQHAL